MNQNILLGSRAQVYRACVRSMLLYRAETWATTKQLEALLIRCDVRMLRYLMGIRWPDGISNEEAVRSGLEGLEELLHKNRLRWFGLGVGRDRLQNRVWRVYLSDPGAYSLPQKLDSAS